MTVDESAVMIDVRDVTKEFPKVGQGKGAGMFLALDGLTLAVAENEFISILGPSGCGKSTLLTMVAGFASPTSGSISVDGEDVIGPSPDKGVVFQEFALFPWLTVRSNVEYGLREQGMEKTRRHDVVRNMLDMVGLSHVAGHFPNQLSGGLKQRASLARVLANDPKILLLDEPFGALDEQRRIQLQDELLRIWETDKKTAMFVTHSVEEAVVLGDRVVIMSAHPGEINSIVNVNLPRPRDRNSDEFNAMRRVVTDALWAASEGS